MPEKPRDDRETAEALEALRQAAGAGPPFPPSAKRPTAAPPEKRTSVAATGPTAGTTAGGTASGSAAPPPGAPPRKTPEAPPLPPRKPPEPAPNSTADPMYSVSPEITKRPLRPPMTTRGESAVQAQTAAPAEPRCLFCGYRLQPETGFRCSECGRRYDGETLARWFDGEEADRFERALWLVRACLFIRLWTLLPLSGFYPIVKFAGGLAAAGACLLAGRGRFDTIGGYYAVAGFIVSCLCALLCWTDMNTSPLGFFTLDIVSAALFMGALARDADGLETWGRRHGKTPMLLMLIGAPLLATTCGYMVNFAGGQILGGLSWLTLALAFGWIIPYAATLFAWIFVWRWLAVFQKTLFGKQKD